MTDRHEAQAERDRRRAEALRANLRRRKAARRGAAETDESRAAPAEPGERAADTDEA